MQVWGREREGEFWRDVSGNSGVAGEAAGAQALV